MSVVRSTNFVLLVARTPLVSDLSSRCSRLQPNKKPITFRRVFADLARVKGDLDRCSVTRGRGPARGQLRGLKKIYFYHIAIFNLHCNFQHWSTPTEITKSWAMGKGLGCRTTAKRMTPGWKSLREIGIPQQTMFS